MTRCSPTGSEVWRAQIGVDAVLVPHLLDMGTYDPPWSISRPGEMRKLTNALQAATCKLPDQPAE